MRLAILFFFWSPLPIDGARLRAMSVVGHVWTAPWQELSDVAAALVGCGHVSGLSMRQVWPAGPNALRGSGPIVRPHLKVR
jgi:hypothetical protein